MPVATSTVALRQEPAPCILGVVVCTALNVKWSSLINNEHRMLVLGPILAEAVRPRAAAAPLMSDVKPDGVVCFKMDVSSLR